MDWKKEDNIPIPDNSSVSPLKTLEVGESILFPASKRNSVQSYAGVLKRRNGLEFTVRKVDDENCRVWRIK